MYEKTSISVKLILFLAIVPSSAPRLRPTGNVKCARARADARRSTCTSSAHGAERAVTRGVARRARVAVYERCMKRRRPAGSLE